MHFVQVNLAVEQRDLAGFDAVRDGLLGFRETPAVHAFNRIAFTRWAAREEPDGPCAQGFLVGFQELHGFLDPVTSVHGTAEDDGIKFAHIPCQFRRPNADLETRFAQDGSNAFCNFGGCTILAAIRHENLHRVPPSQTLEANVLLDIHVVNRV